MSTQFEEKDNRSPLLAPPSMPDVLSSQLRQRLRRTDAILAGLDKFYAWIEFDRNGIIVAVNDLWVQQFGYARQEVVGKHRDILADEATRKNPAYSARWAQMLAGETTAGELKRARKDGTEIWLHASYVTVPDEEGKVASVLIYTLELTTSKLKAMDNEARVAGIDRVQAVVECNMDGSIRGANDNFLQLFGYSLDELRGRDESLLAADENGRGELLQVWQALARGEPVSGEWLRTSRDKREVWVRGMYFPVIDLNGHAYKIVAQLTDVSLEVKARRNALAVQHQVFANAERLSAAGASIRATAAQLATAVEESLSVASVAASISNDVSQNAQVVASGMQGMTASIQEISKNVHEAAQVATRAVQVAESTNVTVRDLGVSSVQIGKVIKVITTIAQQTRLLALNAKIEAARAGAAGKGFAVVAFEVQELAKETAAATDDIGQKIEAIQTAARSTMSAIDEISSIIRQISDFQQIIASAVEEQTAATSEMGRGIGVAAQAAVQIAENVASVARGMQQTSNVVAQNHESAEEIARMAEALSQQASRLTG